MDITRYADPKIPGALRANFVRNNLIYGGGSEYNSLVTPTSTVLGNHEVTEITEDLEHLWKLYRLWNLLYLKSLAGETPKWIKEYTEYGMTQEEIEASRLVSEGGLEPRMCRVDYVRLGTNRCIAEVQWKSGGPGLFFGMQDIYSKVIPPDSENECLGDPVNRFYDTMTQFDKGNETTAINLVRDVWLSGESYLAKQYLEKGLRYIPIERTESGRRITETRSTYSVIDEKGETRRIDFINGQGFTRFFPKAQLTKLARATLDGKVWVETPLNYIYRQKWGLSLPFMDEYKTLFDDRLRKILVPTALLNPLQFDLSQIVARLEHPLKNMLLGVQSIAQLAELPTSLRRSLILKCGAGVGDFYSDGKGVFRLGGSKESSRKILEFIEHRIRTYNEPWVIQPFIDQKYQIPVSLPWRLDKVELIDAHARFLIFGSRFKTLKPRITGGLGNYGAHWKVSGRSPSLDEQGRLCGTAFNDIRINRSGAGSSITIEKSP